MSVSALQARRTRQRQEARRAILDVTEALMVETGGDDFSIRTLAERCGYTPPTIYHYFGDKDGLVDTLLEERFARLLAAMRRVDLAADAAEALRRMAHAFLRFGEENPAFYRLILTSSRSGQDRTPPSAEAARALMEAPWSELQAAGRLLSADRTAAEQSIWALVHGLTALRISRPDYAWSANLIDVSIDSLLRGLIRPAAGEGEWVQP